MPQISQLFFKTAVIWLIIGLAIGLQMGISGSHNTIAAHAHLNLLGWVSSAIFGGYYALNPAKASKRLALVHYAIYTAGLVVMLPALYFMELGNTQLEPIVGIGSIITFVGVLVFAVVLFARETVSIHEARRA
jgi:cbb3-type cytochrome oxidase subunit 1